MSSLFNRGYKKVREEVSRQEKNREKAGKRLWRFFISSDEEATVHFLNEEPISFYEHTIKSVNSSGEETYSYHMCTGEDCPFCADGNRPSFKGAFLIEDKRPFEYTDSSGKKKKGNSRLLLYVAGTKVLSQLDRISGRYGLTKRDYIIIRTGKGQSTSYQVDRTDDVHTYTKEEIKNILPEKLREMYDGTEESLYQILEYQLKMDLEDSTESEDSEVESESNDTLVSIEDDKEEESPEPVSTVVKKPSIKKKSLFKK